MLRFEDLDVEEQRNEILKGIHNRLSEISLCLQYMVETYSGSGLYDFMNEFEMYIQTSAGLYIERRKNKDD